MIFLTKNDILTVIDLTTLDEILDGEDSNLDGFELTAIEEMTAHLNVRYDAETIFYGDDRNAAVVAYCVDIVLYHAHAKYSPDNVPTVRENRWKIANSWLEKVSDGFIKPSLPTKEDKTTLPLKFGSSAPKQDQYF